MKQENIDLANKIENYRRCGYSRKEIMVKLKISENKYNYLTASAEAREKRKEYHKKWREEKNKTPLAKLKAAVRRFQKRSICQNNFTAEDVVNKFGQNPVCYLTGLPINYEDTSTYQLDHMIPIKLGGASSLDNLMICHPMANQMKNGYMLEEFIKFCHLIVKQHPTNKD